MQTSLSKTKNTHELTTTFTMSLLQLNNQISRSNSKLFVEFTRSFGEDLLDDLMNILRHLHQQSLCVLKDPTSEEEAFELMKEKFNESLENRIELLNSEVPRAVRGRKPTKNTSVVAVVDTDDECEKRGRPKMEEAKMPVTTPLNNAAQQLKANALIKKSVVKKSTAKKSNTKPHRLYRKLSRSIEKNGKVKTEKVWRKPDYALKDTGEEWVDTWSVSTTTPNSKSTTFDNEKDAIEYGKFLVEGAAAAIAKVEAPVEKKVEAPKKRGVYIGDIRVCEVEKKVEAPVEKKPTEVVVKSIDEGQLEEFADMDGIDLSDEEDDGAAELQAESFSDEETTNYSFDMKFCPTFDYLPFMGCEDGGDLIYNRDENDEDYGKIIDRSNGKHVGWLSSETEAEMVDADDKPVYAHQMEESDEEEIDQSFQDF